ncbi:MAG: hypothetical protein M3176_07185 [Chloroflexota bacterium]|nr:hypothetical protein [Chloroflexota bacterium]
MVSQCKRTDHRILFTAIALMAATLMLAACGGTSATIAPAPTTAATVAPVATVAVSGGQTRIAPTIAPAATVPAAATQTLPTASLTSGASIAVAATKPAALNANAGSAAGKVDPCTLITKADYLAVMGDAASDPVKKARPTVATAGFSQSSCDYKIAAGGKVEFVTVNVMQRDPSVPAQLDMKTYWEGTKKAWASMQSKVTPLPEIGPEVFLVVNPLLEQIGAAGDVHIFKGDVIFDVQVATGSGTVDEQNAAGTVAAKKLATMAFGRL